VPEPVAVGEPDHGYPYRWAVHVGYRARAPHGSTLARSRGAAINQACAALPYYLHTYPLIVERSWHKLASLGVRPLTAA
jgi:hypothetical protein